MGGPWMGDSVWVGRGVWSRRVGYVRLACESVGPPVGRDGRVGPGVRAVQR